MIRTILCIVCLLSFATSCTPKENLDYLYNMDQAPAQFEADAELKILVTPAEVRNAGTIEKALWDKGIEEGMTKIFSQYLKLGPLVKPVNFEEFTPPDEIDFFKKTGEVNTIPFAATGDYIQKFKIHSLFRPDWKIAGQIVKLEYDRYAVSTDDRITLLLYDYYPRKAPAFFLVGQKADEHEGEFVRIVGSGKILQVLGSTGIVDRNGSETKGMLCQAVIWESYNELYKDDPIYLLEVSIDATQPISKSDITDDETQYPEVMVEPKFEADPIQIPTESK